MHGVDPEDRVNIEGAVSQFVELISNDKELPPKRQLADIFLDRSQDDQGSQITYEQHVTALSELFISAMIMLAEERAESADAGMEIHMLMNGESGSDHVAIRLSGYDDPRYAVAALAKLEEKGYLTQLWNVAVRGKVDPDGPQVFFQDHKMKNKKEESA